MKVFVRPLRLHEPAYAKLVALVQEKHKRVVHGAVHLVPKPISCVFSGSLRFRLGILHNATLCVTDESRSRHPCKAIVGGTNRAIRFGS